MTVLTQHWRRVAGLLLALLLFAPFVSKFMVAQQVLTGPQANAVTAPVPNSALANSSTSVNGQTCTLGDVCTVAAAPSGPAGGDLSGTYPNPVLPNINPNVGTFGGITVNAKGQVTAATADVDTVTLTGDVTGSGYPSIATTLVNKSVTVNGQTCTLGSSCTIPTPGVITLNGSGASIGSSFATVTDGTNPWSFPITGPITLHLICVANYAISNTTNTVSVTVTGTGSPTRVTQIFRNQVNTGPVVDSVAISSGIAAFGTALTSAAVIPVTPTNLEFTYDAVIVYPSGSTTVNVQMKVNGGGVAGLGSESYCRYF